MISQSRTRINDLRLLCLALPGWVLPVALGAALRLVNLGSERLWYDETFTAYLTKLDWAHLWPAILGDNHPPTWYAVEWFWSRLFGTSEAALRLPAALLSILAIYLMWRLALRLTLDIRTAQVAALLLAILPSSLYYAQEARMYSLFLVGGLLFLEGLIRRRSWRIVVGGLALAYAHNVGVIYVLVGGLALLIRDRRDPVRLPRDVMALLGVVAGWAPWAVVGIAAQMRQVYSGFWLPPLQVGDSLFPFLSMSVGTRLSDPLQFIAYAGWLAAVGVALIASRCWLRSGRGRLFLAMSLGVPAATILVSLLWRNVYVARTMLAAVCLLVIPLAWALTHLARPNRRVLVLVTTVTLALGLTAHYFPDANRGRGATDTWLTPIEQGWKPGDVVYHLAVDSAIGVSYYLPGKASALLPESNDLGQSLTDQTKQAMGFFQVKFDALASHGFRRAWLIVNDSPMISAYELAVWADILKRYPATLVNKDDPQAGLAPSYMYLIPLSEVF